VEFGLIDSMRHVDSIFLGDLRAGSERGRVAGFSIAQHFPCSGVASYLYFPRVSVRDNLDIYASNGLGTLERLEWLDESLHFCLSTLPYFFICLAFTLFPSYFCSSRDHEFHIKQDG
jgi:hypothetical protein